MYKYLIIGIALMFITGSGYYLNKSGGLSLIYKASTSKGQVNLVQLTKDDMSGLYVCDEKYGCIHKYILLLQDDMSAEMLILGNIEEIDSEENAELEQILELENDTTTTIDNNEPILANNTQIDNTQELQSVSNETTTDISLTTSTEIIITDTKEPDTTPNNEQEGDTNSVSNNDDSQPDDTGIEEVMRNQNFLSLIQEKNPESTLEKGTWQLDIQNMLVINIETSGTTTLSIPRKFVIKNLDKKLLSNINYTKSVYTSMKNPSFARRN